MLHLSVMAHQLCILRSLPLELGQVMKLSSSLVYVAVPNMVRAVGAIPVFVDSLPGSYQVDPLDIRKKLSNRTKAVIAVHTYGL